MVTCHSKMFESSTRPALKPSMGFFVSSAVVMGLLRGLTCSRRNLRPKLYLLSRQIYVPRSCLRSNSTAWLSTDILYLASLGFKWL